MRWKKKKNSNALESDFSWSVGLDITRVTNQQTISLSATDISTSSNELTLVTLVQSV